MKVFKLDLLEKETEYGFMPGLTAYILDGNPEQQEIRPAVLVIPGGGYDHVSFREGERIALNYSSAGFHTFILDYCVKPHRYPLPIYNVAEAIKTIRLNASEWGVDSKKIAVCGFSAGGHLAASISTMWNEKEIFSEEDSDSGIFRPDASILCYPVITSGKFRHNGTFVNLTGSAAENDLWRTCSLEKRVDENTPAAFIWHTFGDNVVPVENSLLYAEALRKANVPFELHIYPDGEHGLSCVSDETYWKVPKFRREYPWIKQSVEWLYLQFGIIKTE